MSLAYNERKSISFVENRGQWQDGSKYKAALPCGMMQLTDQGFEYRFLSENDLQRIEAMMDKGQNVDSIKVKGHIYKVNFIGANKDIKYKTEEKRTIYHNYFIGNDTSMWKGKVGLHGKVVQQNVYKGIDVALYSKGKALKYDFIIAPGAHVKEIELGFEGVVPELTDEGNLRIITSVNEVIEQAPYAYQIINDQEIVVKCNFKLRKGRISFEFPDGYNPEYMLIIDPELVFVTFSGAGDFVGGYYSFCTTYDEEGHLYAAGIPIRGLWAPDPLWPTTPGAFQENWTTIYEPMACINKYKADGSGLIYSTYLGGNGPNDIPHAMIVNDQEELIVAGSTGSFWFPVTPGCFDDTKSGGTDIFIARFNKDGSALLGATYMGGNTGNSINAIDMFSKSGFTNQNKTSPIDLALDGQNNIWVVSSTSAIDFPVTANAFQSKYGDGSSDGVVFALDPTCSRLIYGSYIGGDKTDIAYGLQFNSLGNLVICGGTQSANFPATSEALHSTARGTGEWDGFVSIIDTSTGALLASTYLGTDKDDQSIHVQLDKSDHIYVLGRTFGNYPIKGEVFKMPETDLFIEKLSPALDSSLLSTRIGNQQGAAPFFPTAFLVDNCTNVYVTGLAGDYKTPLSNMPLTENAMQTTPGNFWYCVLRPDFSDLLYATYLGRVDDASLGINGDHTHVGANRMDPQGIVYHSLCVNSKTYPGTTSESWSPTNLNTVGQDIVSFKFAFNLSGVEARFRAPAGQKDSACAPYTVSFENRSKMAMDYVWDFGDGSPLVHNEPNPSHTYLREGVFTVSLRAHNDTTCITDDTSYKTITVFDPKKPDITVQDTLVCSHEDEVTLNVQVNNPTAYNQYLWEPASGIISGSNAKTVVVNPNIDTQYFVTVWDTIPGFCGYRITDTIHIDYKPRALNILNNDTLVCEGTAIQMTVTGTTGYTYEWAPPVGVSDIGIQNPIIIANEPQTYTVTASYPGCADTAKSIIIHVDKPFAVSFSAEPDSICAGETISFFPKTDSTTFSLNWQFGDSMEMTSETGMLHHAYDRSGIMQVMLTAHARACPDTSFTDQVYVFELPDVYLGADTSICPNTTPIVLRNLRHSIVSHNNMWNTGAITESIEVVSPGIYTLTVSNEPLGCSNTGIIEIMKDCYIDIPNAFTPDGDGVNDYFFPRQLLSKNITLFRMQILNRWGQLIFETTNMDGRGWDGQFNGKDQPQGVYVYLIDVEIDGSKKENYQGNVTLIR